ncbi:MAG TPA: S1C family serine protease [Candidatus Gemmiger avistercoris]|uniref:S1C family serine protease n=1 Tax=Candidatus Gemmiger avistercoris TaxID=2838606 RepID=A0A9D2FJK7_9FIRM|nr:trypsin-like peptidase domain-containing protein [uncultured Subdoligranulum sp.]HIZ61752.1 S1C family serine protease [Candidatus Gemmiger avistercoris]
MSNEYDYSGLYDHTSDGGAPRNSAQDQQPAETGSQNSYPNVGSSGMNTANTARTDYSSAQSGAAGSPAGGSNGYTSSFSGGSGSNGGYNGYSYASAPQQPAPKPPRKGRRTLLRVLACVGVAALGFGGGIGGAVLASRTGLTGNQVVVQQVQRDTSDAANANSTGGESMSLQQISSVVSPSVVAITTEQMSGSQTWFGGYYVQSGAGSGVIISQDGYILTCAHVVDGATSVKVQLQNGETYDASIVGSDATSDIAVLKIEATGLTPAVIGDSDALAVGETVVAVGNPLGTLSNTVTDGIISALNREVTVEDNDMTLLQTNASISPGNSGGGLFNANGELIGIVNAKSSYSEAEGIGFAIPIDQAMEIAQQLIENGAVIRPALGVKILDVMDANTANQLGVSATGVYVVEVTAGGGAEAAGVQAGDRIIAVDDTAVSSSNSVKSYLADKQVGDTVNLQVEREGKVLTLSVTLGSGTQ